MNQVLVGMVATSVSPDHTLITYLHVPALVAILQWRKLPAKFMTGQILTPGYVRRDERATAPSTAITRYCVNEY